MAGTEEVRGGRRKSGRALVGSCLFEIGTALDKTFLEG